MVRSRCTVRRVVGLLVVAAVVSSCAGGSGDAAGGSNGNATSSTLAPPDATTSPPADIGAPISAAPVDGPTAGETTTTTTTPRAPSLPSGPYGVGLTTIGITDPARGRTLTVDVWYPVAAGTTGEPGRYALTPEFSFPSSVAIADAPVAAGGPFPLVVFSHGQGGIRWQSTFLTEALASHGYVVAAPDHVGDTAVDVYLGTAVPFDVAAHDRVLDVSTVIDGLVSPAAPAAARLAVSVDADRIAVVGHSFGGFTAFASVSGWSGPAGDAPGDPRVDAIVALAPATRILSDEELARVTVPALVLTGTRDLTTPIETETSRPWALAGATPFFRGDLLDAGHQSFTDACAWQAGLPGMTGAPAGLGAFVDSLAASACTPEFMDVARVHDLTTGYVPAFLDEFVAGVDGAAAPLDAAVTSPPPDVVLLVERRDGPGS